MHRSLITRAEDLSPIIARLRADRFVALDTEFVWTSTYFPNLGVVQLGAADGSAWVVDAAAIHPALADLIADPDTVKILHDARQDLALLRETTGASPRNVFDTRLAAGFAGFDPTVSLKQLLNDLLGIDLPKTETRTDWCRRPLSPAQIDYALNDVRHAAAMHQSLRGRAAERGTEVWMAEEMRQFDDPDLYAPPDPAQAWRRIKGGDRLSPREHGRLRALAARREQCAIEWNLPRNWVVDDASLLDLARRAPAAPGDFRLAHRLSRQRLEMLKQNLFEALQTAVTAPDATDPDPSPMGRPAPATKRRIDEALDFLRQRAAALGLAPELFGSRAQVAAFVAAPNDASLPLASGWRYETAGRDLAARLAPEEDLFGNRY